VVLVQAQVMAQVMEVQAMVAQVLVGRLSTLVR
jgi:hypothetical protein